MQKYSCERPIDKTGAGINQHKYKTQIFCGFFLNASAQLQTKHCCSLHKFSVTSCNVGFSSAALSTSLKRQVACHQGFSNCFWRLSTLKFVSLPKYQIFGKPDNGVKQGKCSCSVLLARAVGHVVSEDVCRLHFEFHCFEMS